MNTALTLIRREWLEHRNAYVYAPLVVLALILISSSVTVWTNPIVDVDAEQMDAIAGHTGEDGLRGIEVITAIALDAAGSTEAELEVKLAKVTSAIAQPFYVVFAFVAFFALVACVHDERKDRSVLFWKSMPVSDTATIVSKFATILWVGPLATIAAIWLAQLIATATLAFYVEDGFGAQVWAASGLLSSPFKLVMGYALQGLWVLPVAAWVLLVSSYASKAPILLALGIPAALMFLERILFGSHHLVGAVGTHLGFAALPDSNGLSFDVLTRTTFWVGIIVGAAFIIGAIALRRKLNEV